MRTRQVKIFLAIAAATDRTAYSLAAEFGITPSAIGRNLRQLEQTGLITRGGKQKNIRWRATDLGKVAAVDLAKRFGTPELPESSTVIDVVEVPAKKASPGQILHPTYRKLERYITGGVRAIWLTGEAGVGKTYAVEQIAKDHGYELFVSTPVNDKYELLGYNDMNGNAVITEIYRWATFEGPAVLMLDEVDGNMAAALLALNAMLANWIGVFPSGKVRISDDKIVIATANTTGQGATIKYCGRQPLDAAFLDRFEMQLHWGLHEATEKAIANLKVPGPNTDGVVRMSWKIRRNLSRYGIDLDWGPRRTYALARAVACGFSLREAAVDVALGKLAQEEQDNALEGVL